MKDFRELEFTKKLKKAQSARSKGYEDRILKEGDLVFYQHQGNKSWLGPVEVFTVKDNNIFIFTNGSIRKVPRCNVQYLRSKEEDKPEDSSKAEVTGDAEEKKVEFEEEEFGEGIDEKDIEEIGRRRTRSMTAVERRELERDKTATFWLQMDNTECFDDVTVYA